MAGTSINHHPKSETKYATRRSVWNGGQNRFRDAIETARQSQGVTVVAVQEYYGAIRNVFAVVKSLWPRQVGPVRGRSIMAVLIAAMVPTSLAAAPAGPQTQAGAVTVAATPGRTAINQSSHAAIINWQSFSIGIGEQVVIQQPNAAAALLNRVTGASPSTLLGSLNANGQVYLVNPNGVVVGQGAQINAGAFFASTSQISDPAFMAGGSLTFSGGTDASVVNLGIIKSTTGDAVLVGHRVDNEGKIDAPNGTAALIAATEFTYTPGKATPVTVAAGHSTDTGGVGVNNAGRIKAANAQLVAADGNLYALAVNQSGVVKATGVKMAGGRILLTADGGTVSDSGTLSAHKANGSGGSVIVGGTHQGANPRVPNATTTVVSSTAVINVAAKAAKGNGGKVTVWSTQQTNFAGTIDGQGGAQGGNGGNAAVSSAHTLNYTGLTDLRAAYGSTGTLTLDPDQAFISSATDDQANGVFNAGVLATALATANVTVDTSTGYGNGNTQFGDITVNAAVNWASGLTLTLKSADNIIVNANLTGGTGSGIVFAPGVAGDGGVSVLTTGNLTVASNATVHAGIVTITENNAAASSGSGNLPPLAQRSIGTVAFNGILQAGTLDLQLNDAGAKANVTIANPSNAIGTLASSVATGTVGGTLNIVNGSGNLSVTGAFTNVGGQVDIQSAGNLTLASGAAVSTDNTGGADIHLIAGGSFTNNAGASAVAINGAGRYLIYSDAPATTTLGGLPVTPVYNTTFAANAPASITQTGNRVLYSLAPTLTFTADNQTSTYGSAIPGLTYTLTGLVGGDTAAKAFSGTPSTATSATSSSNAGSYTITAAMGSVLASDYNYKLSFVPGTLTINPATLTITTTSATKTYGDLNPTFSVTSTSGLMLGQSLSQLGTLVLSSAATQSSNTGTYAITGGLTGATSLASNYTISVTGGSLTINPAALTITTASATKTYGDLNPTFSVASTSGLVLGQSLSQLGTLVLSSTATQSSNVGNYAITGGLTGATSLGSNYTISVVGGTLTVNPAPLSVQVGNVSRFYGDANPNGNTVALTATGLVLGQNVTQALSVSYSNAGLTANAGNYTIDPSLISANYTIASSTSGVLTVLPRPIALTPSDIVRYYGTSNPAYTILVAGNGLASFDTIASVASLTTFNIDGAVTSSLPAAGANAGQHILTAVLTNNPNYAVTSVPAIFAILPRPTTLTVADVTGTAGTPLPAYSATVSNLAAGDSITTALPGLTLTAQSQSELTVANAYTPTTYPLPAGFLPQSQFSSNYPPLLFASGTTTLHTPGPTQPSTLTSHAIPTLAPTTTFNFTPINVSTSATKPTVSLIVPGNYAGNPNYIVTGINLGTQTVNPSPATVTAATEAAAAALAAANKAAFLSPAGGVGAFGLPPAALPSLVTAIKNEIASQIKSGGGVSSLSQTIEAALGRPPGTVMTDADLYAYLDTLSTSPTARSVIGAVLSSYVTQLASEPAGAYSASDTALANYVDGQMAAAKTQLATAALAQQAAWVATQKASDASFSMTNLFGTTVPYGQFISQAATTVAQNAADAHTAGTLVNKAGYAGVAAAAGVTAAAGTTLVLTGGTGAIAAVAPFAVSAAAATTATTVGTFAGPVGIVVVAIIGIGLEAVQVANNADQQRVFNALTNPASAPPTLALLDLNTKTGTTTSKTTATVDAAILNTAIATIISQ